MSTPTHTAMGPGAEFDAIRRLLEQWGPHSIGAGDDAAVLDVPAGEQLIATVDTFVEGVHFRRAWITPAEIGYRAVTAALSDVAAMGALPLGVLTAIVLPDPWRDKLSDIAEGIGIAVADAETTVRGGNMSAGAELSITTTVLGHADAVLRRDRVRAGDALYVTGRLGGVGAALAALLAGRAPAPEHRERFAHPVARLHEARWLAHAGVTAAVDISDGLSADAGHLAAASGVGIELDLGAVPLVAGVQPRDALASGEEYELLVAASGALDAAAFETRFGIPLTRVGRAVSEHPGTVEVLDAGRRVAAGRGHDHLSA
ncbi:MAG TPA: thiamine-phosphate kinase [Gemmatimonadaceae bacterium]|nr:thiamine-phosphate kinase [Gemmatimonadaceae bacterium]